MFHSIHPYVCETLGKFLPWHPSMWNSSFLCQESRMVHCSGFAFLESLLNFTTKSLLSGRTGHKILLWIAHTVGSFLLKYAHV